MKREWVRRSLGAWLGIAACALAYACNDPTTVTPVGDADVARDGSIDAAADAPDGALDVSETCAPTFTLEDFKPTWHPPAPFAQGACTDAQVDALMCAFDSSANLAACNALAKDVANKACLACMFTASSAPKLGPIVLTGNLGSINLAGCIANSEADSSGESCGARFAADEQCADEACEPQHLQCAYEGEPLDAPIECTDRARRSVCASYATAAECADPLLAPGGIAAACSAGVDFLSRATSVAKLFCTGLADAAADASEAG